MKKSLVGFVILAVIVLLFTLEGFTYYWFLSPESNTALELWKSKAPISKHGYYYAIISDRNGTTSFLEPAPYEDVVAAPTDIKVGEEWIGPSSNKYIVTLPASKETGAEQINAKLDTTLVLVKKN